MKFMHIEKHDYVVTTMQHNYIIKIPSLLTLKNSS